MFSFPVVFAKVKSSCRNVAFFKRCTKITFKTSQWVSAYNLVILKEDKDTNRSYKIRN